jgi:hypothetical protein
VTLPCLIIKKLIHRIWTRLDNPLALKSHIIEHIIRLTSVRTTMTCCIIIIIAGTLVDALFGQLVEGLVYFAHRLAG